MTRGRRLWFLILLVSVLGFLGWLTWNDRDQTPNEPKEMVEVLKSEQDADGEAVAGDEIEPQGEAMEPDEENREILISGSVTLAKNDEPVANAEVLLNQHRGDSDSEMVSTDSNGEFRLYTRQKGRRLILARKGALISYLKRAETNLVDLGKDVTAVGPIHLKLYPTRILKVHVVSRETGESLSDAKCETLHQPSRVVLADDKGIVTLPLSREVWRLAFSAPGYELRVVNFNLAKGDDGEFKVALSAGGEIFGKVVNQDNEPVADALVWAMIGSGYIRATSDETGSFLLEGIPIATGIRVSAHKQDVGNCVQDFRLEHGDQTPLTLRLEPRDGFGSKTKEPMVVEGVVVDTEDRPIEAARVYFAFDRFGDDGVEVFSGEDGSFQIVIQPAGRFGDFLWVSKPGYATQKVPFSTDPASATNYKVVMKAGHYLRGWVLGPDHEPIAKARVNWRLAERNARFYQRRPPLTDDSGYFELTGLPAEINLSIFANGYTEKTVELPELDRDDATYILEALGSIHGKVVFKETGEPVPAYKLTLRRVKRVFFRFNFQTLKAYYEGVWVVADDGAFEASGLPVGVTFSVRANTEDHFQEEPMEVAVPSAGEKAPVLLELSPNKDSYAGVVVDREGRPLAGAHVRLFAWSTNDPALYGHNFMSLNSEGEPEGASFRANSQSASNGSFRFDGVPAKVQVLIEARAEGFANEKLTQVETYSPDKKQNLRVLMSRECKLLISVLEDPLPDQTKLILQGNDWVQKTFSVTEINRSFDVEKMKPGDYEVLLHTYETGNGVPVLIDQVNVSLQEGESRTIEIGDRHNFKLTGVALEGSEVASGRKLRLRADIENSWNPLSVGQGQVALTDGNGQFEFSELSPGQYRLELCSRQPVDPPSALGSGLPDNGNLLQVVIKDEDVNDRFHFKKLSRVYGQLAKTEGVSSLLFSNHPFRCKAVNVRATMAEDGAFQFLDISGGIYSLHARITSQNQPALLLSEITVPEGGGDIDLGLIHVEKVGDLRIRLAGPSTASHVLDVYVFNLLAVGEPVETLYQRRDWYNFRDFTKPYKVNDLPVGTYRVVGRLLPFGWVTQPLSSEVEIREGETTELTLRAIPVTEIQLALPGKEIVERAFMVHEASGDVLNFVLSNDEPVFLGLSSLRFAASKGHSLHARGFAEGLWQVQIENSDGRIYQRRFEARKGEGQILQIHPGDELE